MRIFTFLLVALLIAAIGGGVFLFFTQGKPMYEEYTRMKAGMPELDRAKAELKKYKDKESRDTAWIKPAIDELNAGLSDEIKAGQAEIAAAGNAIVVNFAEKALYTPGSVTFSKDSPQLRLKLATLLGSQVVKGKEIVIGNSAPSSPAQGKGRKRIPPKDGRTLAAERSLALVKYLEQNKVEQERLLVAAYPEKTIDAGFKIKGHRTVIVIQNPPAVGAAQPVPAVKTEGKPATKPTGTQQGQPQTIPIKPVQPKTN